MANNIQLEQTIADAQNSPVLRKINSPGCQIKSTDDENVQRRLSDDPRYGPEVAAEYPQFVGSLPEI
jgi:conjugal transfer mating pair stabilization protein TraG